MSLKTAFTPFSSILNPAAFADNRANRSEMTLSLQSIIQSKSAPTVGEVSEATGSPNAMKASSSVTAFMLGLKPFFDQYDFKFFTSCE